MRTPRRLFIGCLAAVALIALLPAALVDAAPAKVAEVSIGAGAVAWQPQIDRYKSLTLFIAGPSGSTVHEFETGRVPVFTLVGGDGVRHPDGVYKWELRATPQLDEATRDALARDRAEGAGHLTEQLRADGVLPAAVYQSGSFAVLGGALVSPGLEEIAPASAEGAVENTSGAVSSMSGEVLLTAADGVIRNSSCVGGDCPNTPTFSDTTMLMMENNTRIKFDDTSSAASFPRNDWEIEANSSSNGGLSYLGINDCGQSTQGGCATDLVFAVEAGAPQSALYVEDSGDVGLGTSNPILELHVVDGDSPSLRLQQDGSSGFTPQIWDLAGNETNFFLRDATNGSTLPFRVEPGAETSLLHLTDDDHVGIGTGSASARLHVRDGDVDEVALLESRGNSTRFRVLNTNDTSCPAGSDCSWSVGGRQSSNFFITRDGTGTDECTLTPSGNFSCIGTVSGSSSRTLKSDILPVDPRRMLTRVLSLPITEWTYTRELADGVRHVSPIAEDFYDTFGLGYDEKLLAAADVAGVALAAIQGLHQIVAEKDARLDALQAENERKDAALMALAERLERLEAQLQ